MYIYVCVNEDIIGLKKDIINVMFYKNYYKFDIIFVPKILSIQ